MVMDIWDPNVVGLDEPGSGEDYVSKEQIKDLILKNNIVPVSTFPSLLFFFPPCFLIVVLPILQFD